MLPTNPVSKHEIDEISEPGPPYLLVWLSYDHSRILLAFYANLPLCNQRTNIEYFIIAWRAAGNRCLSRDHSYIRIFIESIDALIKTHYSPTLSQCYKQGSSILRTRCFCRSLLDTFLEYF
jgi:hypothetical protein